MNERHRAASRDHYRRNREAILARRRERYAADPAPTLTRNTAWRDANRDRAVAYRMRQRARAAGVACDMILPSEVLSRYGATCYLCQEPLDLSLEWPDPMMFTVDHVIPFARGGAHVMANCRPAHLRCNRRKYVHQDVTLGTRHP